MGKIDLTGMDTRVVAYHLRNRNITQEEYDAYVAGLPDEAEEGAETETTFTSPYAERMAAEAAGETAEA